eukprot:1161424-Pelagomonas_calceolata.AAC.7
MLACAQEILRYSTTDVLAPQWAAMEAGVRRAADADQVLDDQMGWGCHSADFLDPAPDRSKTVWMMTDLLIGNRSLPSAR